MAQGLTSQPAGLANKQFKDTGTPDSFISFGDFIDTVDKPVYEEKIQPKYMQELGISELIKNFGGEFPVERDSELYHYEQTRRYINGVGTAGSAIAASDTGTLVITDNGHLVREDDDLALNGGRVRVHVTATTTNTFTVVPKSQQWGTTIGSGDSVSYFVFGNEHGKGTDQPRVWHVPNVDRIESTLMIMKDDFKMTGSQMTNGSWIKTPDGKDAYIFYAEEEGYKRFRAYEEMEMVLGQKATNTNLSSDQGTEGLFDATERRGNVWNGYINSLTDVDDIVEAFDSESGPMEYAVYSNTRQFNSFQDMISDATGLVSYGMFNNGKDDAVKFGFKGLNRSGYDIYFHKWPLLTNPQLLGSDQYYKALWIPQGEIKDATTSASIPHISMLYKQHGSYSRRYETQMSGFANGVKNDPNGNDSITVDYRSEIGFRGAAMNCFLIQKG